MLIWKILVTEKTKALVALTTPKTHSVSMFDSKFPCEAMADIEPFYQNYMPETLVSVIDYPHTGSGFQDKCIFCFMDTVTRL